MGIRLGDLVPVEKIELGALNGKVVAFDAYNVLYQFLASLRRADGTPIMDFKGRSVGHLMGILQRTSHIVAEGIRPVYVFDGKPPGEKARTLDDRRTRKESARRAWEAALEAGDLETARRKAAQTTRLTHEQADEAKRVLNLLGIPVIEAPSEGEAQASHMVRSGTADAVGSQDFDCLLFGAPVLARNIAIGGRRKLPRQRRYQEVKPEIVRLDKVLETLQITREQLVDMAILMGTDFNAGVKGVGPKRALELVRKYGRLEDILSVRKLDRDVLGDFHRLREIFLEPEVSDTERLVWGPVDDEGVKRFLCGEHDFSEERVQRAIDRFTEFREALMQRSLDAWT